MELVEDDGLVRWAWNQQGLWSTVADRAARRLSRARTVTLALTVLAAVFVTTPSIPALQPAKSGLFWAASACTAVVALTQTMIGSAKTQERMRLRWVAESLKSTVYTYLAGVAPYRGAERDSAFRRAIDKEVDNAGDLVDRIVDVKAPAKALPAVHDVDSYVAVRLQGQLEGYYRPKSIVMKRHARQFRIAATVLVLFSAFVSATIAMSLNGWATAWLPVITTASAALAAEAGVRRFASLALEYARTATELERLLRDRKCNPTSDGDDDAFVAAVERSIAQQNEAWVTRGLAAAESAAPPKSPGVARGGAA